LAYSPSIFEDSYYGDAKTRVYNWYGVFSNSLSGTNLDDSYDLGNFTMKMPSMGWESWVPSYLNSSNIVGSYFVPTVFGFAGASRTSVEPCNPCIGAALSSSTSPSFAVAAAKAVENYYFQLNDFYAVQYSIEYMVKALEDLAMSNNMVTFPTTYVGWPTEDSVLVKQCSRWTSDCPAGTTAPYVAWVTSLSTFGDQLRRLYEVDADGAVVGNMSTYVQITQSNYTVTQRPWFKARAGWTGSFGAFETVDSIRSFSYPLSSGSNGGVAAISWYGAEAPQCNFSAAAIACHNASYAEAAAQAAAMLGSKLRGAFDEDNSVYGAAAFCSMLLQTTMSTNQGFYGNVYLSYPDNRFYMIKYCDNTITASSLMCGTANYTCWVRDTAVFEDNQRHVVPMMWSASGYTADPSMFVAVAGAYVPTMRPWYLQLNVPGWSNSTYPFASGGAGESYSFPVIGGGVAAADRGTNEPCSACLISALSSDATVPVVKAVAAAMVGYGNQTTMAGVAMAAQALLRVAQAGVMAGQLLPGVYVGFPNNDDYFVMDCHSPLNSCGNSSAAVAVWVRNDAVFGPGGLRRLIGFSADGLLMTTNVIEVGTTPFMTTQRAWYVGRRGWSDSFVSASNNMNSRSYSALLPGGAGVAAFSWYQAMAPQCNFSQQTVQCHGASYAPGAAGEAANVGTFTATMRVSTLAGVEGVCSSLYSATVGMNNVSSCCDHYLCFCFCTFVFIACTVCSVCRMLDYLFPSADSIVTTAGLLPQCVFWVDERRLLHDQVLHAGGLVQHARMRDGKLHVLGAQHGGFW
jgi:hypothetical protein